MPRGISFTRESLRAFWRDGFCELGRVLAPAELDDLRDRFERLFYPVPNALAENVRDLSEKAGQPLTRSMLQRVDLHEVDSSFSQLVRRTALLDIAETILGPKIRLFRDQGFYKPAGHGGEVYMHQDNRYWHLKPAAAITVWIALDHTTVENGCLHYLPGSHHLGQIEHVRAADGKSILLEAVADKKDALPVELRAGHAVMHHCQTVHYSPPNRSQQLRRGYTIQYIADNVTQRGKPLTELALLR